MFSSGLQAPVHVGYDSPVVSPPYAAREELRGALVLLALGGSEVAGALPEPTPILSAGAIGSLVAPLCWRLSDGRDADRVQEGGGR
jgi:hypothetical protein